MVAFRAKSLFRLSFFVVEVAEVEIRFSSLAGAVNHFSCALEQHLARQHHRLFPVVAEEYLANSYTQAGFGAD